MPPEAFLMTGGAAPFGPAQPCPGTDGPHFLRPGEGNYLVADAATRDGSAAARLVLWRCSGCGVQVAGLGRVDADPDAEPGYGVHSQEFAWMEEAVVLLEPDGRSHEGAGQSGGDW